MMSRAILVLLAVIGVLFATAAAQPQQCPENQEWTSCGSACPPTCGLSSNRPCTLQCVMGCQCKEGYALNNAGNCVHFTQC